MNNPDVNTLDPHIESLIEAYEDSLAANGAAELSEFLPDRTDPQFLRIATELIRVDLELSWDAGKQKSVNDYKTLLPEIANNVALRTEIAFEEFRQRTYHGEAVTIEQFSSKYNITPDGWTTVVANKDQTTSDADFDDLAQRVPTTGQRWRDFEVIREIGRGAMSRVLLAKQTSLSGRQVVLKFSPKHFVEADKLARLQHPNIVPVFSVYEDRDFHVFCMPYMGDVTLAHRKLPLSEREALDIAAKLAAAIQHAHGRGILHNDIKPANVLWSDEQPMLLDFNLAAETTEPTDAHVGGTLPYMAPESLVGLKERKQVSNEQTDLYSLGVLLLKLVTAEHAFGKHTEIDAAVAARRGPLSDKTDAALARCTPAFQSILKKCLAYEPAQRYGSASDLLTDLERQQNDLPLQHAENNSFPERTKKWCRRHPKLTSLTSIATVSAAVIAFAMIAWSAREQHVDQLEAAATYKAFQEQADSILLELSSVGLDAVDITEAVAKAESILQTYVDAENQWTQSPRYVDLSSAECADVDRRIEKLSFMTSSVFGSLSARGEEDTANRLAALRWFDVAESLDQESKSLLLLKSDLSANIDDAESLRLQADSITVADSTDLQLVGWLKRRQGKTAEAIDDLRHACDIDPKDYSKWYSLSRAYVDAKRLDESEHCLTTCLALQTDSALARYTRGLGRQQLGKNQDAIDDFSRFLEIAPKHPYGLLNRAIAYKQAGQLKLALGDLDQAVSLGFDSSRPLLIRSRVKNELGDVLGAADDYKKAMAATPRDELGWIVRGTARMEKQPDGALKDFAEALKFNPRSHGARRNMAYVLSEKLSRTDDAIKCLNELIADYPLDDSAFGGRGVLLARSEQFDKAITDAKRIVALDGGPRALLQAACIYSMASSKQPELQKVAVSLLGSSFKVTPKLVKLAEVDSDLKEIHDFHAFQELCSAAKKFADVPSAEAAIGTTPTQ